MRGVQMDYYERPVNLGELFSKFPHASPSSYEEQYQRMRYTNKKVLTDYLSQETLEQRESKYQFCL